MMVWAFSAPEDAADKRRIYESVNSGKSRFGWSHVEQNNLKPENNRRGDNSRQLFLLEIQQGDWIVHINIPDRGKCVAVKVLSEYDFDEGIDCGDRRDFRHYFRVDVHSITEFDRKDPNLHPKVNLRPRGRYHRVYDINEFNEFRESITNPKERRVELGDKESKEEHFLKKELCKHLPLSEISKLVHDTHKGKNLEPFFAKVFRKVPGVTSVIENGSGWGSDHGADLILTTNTLLGSLDIENKVVVQIKSFKDTHYDTGAVAQIKQAIEEYSASAGFIITTAESSEQLESAVESASKDINCPISLLASEDMVKFVIKYAPELLFE